MKLMESIMNGCACLALFGWAGLFFLFVGYRRLAAHLPQSNTLRQTHLVCLRCAPCLVFVFAVAPWKRQAAQLVHELIKEKRNIQLLALSPLGQNWWSRIDEMEEKESLFWNEVQWRRWAPPHNPPKGKKKASHSFNWLFHFISQLN